MPQSGRTRQLSVHLALRSLAESENGRRPWGCEIRSYTYGTLPT